MCSCRAFRNARQLFRSRCTTRHESRHRTKIRRCSRYSVPRAHSSSWYTIVLKRVTKSPKLHFLDAGLLAALRALTPERLRLDRTPFGPVLETFVLGKFLKLASWAHDRYTFSHFRDKDRNEVDIVIEDGLGHVVGVEVKASVTVLRRGDFAGLRRRAAATRDNFAMSLVPFDDEYVVPYEDRVAATPLSALWS